MSYLIYTDGGSRGNPGPSGAGACIINTEGVVIAEISEYLGIQTNNYAEYRSLYFALIKCTELGINQHSIKVFMDSKLVIEQVSGRWKVKKDTLQVLHQEIKELLCFFKDITFTHILRVINKHADSLANKAMDYGADKDIKIKL